MTRRDRDHDDHDSVRPDKAVESDGAEFLADLAKKMHDTNEPDHTLAVMFEQAATLLPHADHISVTVRARRGKYASLADSSPLAAKVDQLQYELDQGPCVDAAAPDGQAWYRTGDLANDDRWPLWAPQAVSLGINSLLTVQLLKKEQPFGAINMFAEEPGQFVEPHQVDRVLVWAVHVATALDAARTEQGLKTAASARHEIGVAQGILMQIFDLDLDSSFSYLARLASHHERRLHEVAADIVRTREVPRL